MAHPHAIWKGAISFGLVNIPVALYSAEDRSKHISFRQVDKRNNATIKYQRINSETGKEVPWEKVARGYEYTKDEILLVGDDELKRIAGDNARVIAIEAFVDKKNINMIDVERAFYLEPDKKGEKGYVILREALLQTNKVGIAKIIISTKEYLAAVAVFENALVVYTLHYADEMRDVKDLDLPSTDLKKYKVTGKEIEVAKKLVQSMSTAWKPEKYKDEYKVAVHKWLEEKIKKMPHSKMPSRVRAAEKGRAVNFVDLLRKSLEKPSGKKSRTIKHKKMPVAKRRSAGRLVAVRH